MSRKKFILLFTVYCLLFTLFTVYSYAHVDLNLTLLSNPTYQSIQKHLIYLGYFNRPLSTILFLSLLSLFLLSYFLLVRFHVPWRLTTKQLWTLIISGSILLTLSYPAFAHDLFNYLFDARIVVKYHQNPWNLTPLDFPQDEWTRFMRWTHVGSVYPPGWIIVSIPFYLLGFGKFTLTLLSFKLFGLIAFILSSWLVLKLAGRDAWVLWSFNPMVLIESLSSVHNDIVMVSFALLGIYLFKKRSKSSRVFQNIPSYLLVIYSGLVKYTGIVVLPFLGKPVRASVAVWAGSIAVIAFRGINPWYVLLPVAISFVSGNRLLTKIGVIASLVVLYRYYPCVAIFSC